MVSGVKYAGVVKKGSSPRTLAARGSIAMSAGSGRDERARERRRATGHQDRITRHTTGPRQLITFVDSQDPNSRSTIQRHTAHHSNAQRRDARLQSLRSTNRPRILRWSRRQSADVLPVTSPASSHSSSSISPLPPAQQAQPPGDDSSSTPPVVTSEIQSADLIRPPSAAPTVDRFSPQRESAIQYCEFPSRLTCLPDPTVQTY